VNGPLFWFLIAVLSLTTSHAKNEHDGMDGVFVIAPYLKEGTWVFDDEKRNLIEEPFVAGVPEIINELVEDIPNARAGFRLTFSAKPFLRLRACCEAWASRRRRILVSCGEFRKEGMALSCLVQVLSDCSREIVCTRRSPEIDSARWQPNSIQASCAQTSNDSGATDEQSGGFCKGNITGSTREKSLGVRPDNNC
jgi:hypothetical protein